MLSEVATAKSFNGFGGAGFKNLIHNPMLDIHQRGNNALTSGPHTEFMADRWYLGVASWTNVSISSSLTPDNRQFPNTTLNVRALTINNMGSSNYVDFSQTHDEYWKFTGRTMTLSFSYGSNITTVNSGQVIIGVRVNGAWQYQSMGFTPTNGGDHTFTFTWPAYQSGMTACQIIIRQIRTTPGVIWLSRVQLEEGPVKTPFEHRGLAIESLICQRYYQTLYFAYLPLAYHGGITNTVNLPYLVPMRSSPISHTFFDTYYVHRYGMRDYGDVGSIAVGPNYFIVNNYGTTSITLASTNGPWTTIHNVAIGLYADIQ